MSQQPRCRICLHIDRAAIDAALVRGEPVRQLARRLEIPRSTLQDHQRKGHMAKALAKAADAEAMADGDALMKEIHWSLGELRRLARKSEMAGDARGAMGGHEKLTRLYALLADLEGRLRGRTTQFNLVLAQLSDAELDARLRQVQEEARRLRDYSADSFLDAVSDLDGREDAVAPRLLLESGDPTMEESAEELSEDESGAQVFPPKVLPD